MTQHISHPNDVKIFYPLLPLVNNQEPFYMYVQVSHKLTSAKTGTVMPGLKVLSLSKKGKKAWNCSGTASFCIRFFMCGLQPIILSSARRFARVFRDWD